MLTRSLVFACLLVSTVAGAQEPSLRRRIETELSTPHFSFNRGERIAAEWGTDSVPIMLELLANPAFRESEAKILNYLAAVGGDAAFPPIMAAIRRAETEDSSLGHSAYYALGTLGTREARDALIDAAADTERRDWILTVLRVRDTTAALQTLRAIRERHGVFGSIDAAIAEVEAQIETAEDLAWARARTDFAAEAAAAFWGRQETLPNPDLAGAIIGRYRGLIYRADETPLPVEVEFLANGSFRSTVSLAPDSGAGPFIGTFAVPSPTQLIVAPGRGVTAFDVDLRGDDLSFRHREMEAHFVLRRENAAEAPSSGIDTRAFTGQYRGTAYYAHELDETLRAVDGVEIVFGRSGAIDTNFGSDHDGLYLGFNRAEGDYRLAPSGRLVTTFAYNGGDFFGSTGNGFYNWLWRDGQLYFSMSRGSSYGSIHAATPEGAQVALRNEDVLRTLAAGRYIGVAYRATRSGIERVPNLRIEFRPDGTYRLDSRVRLRPPRARPGPEDEGPYVALTERHLYLGRAYGDGSLSAAVIADVQIDGDRLHFTSLADDAYFVFERE